MTIMPRMERLSPLLLLLLSACAGAGSSPAPEGWKTAGDPQTYTFALPQDFTEQSAGEFRTATTTLRCEFGPDADPLDAPAPQGAERNVDSVIVDGHPARLVRTAQPERKRWEIAVHVWNLPREDNAGLTMVLVSTEPLTISFASRIFSSVHFATK